MREIRTLAAIAALGMGSFAAFALPNNFNWDSSNNTNVWITAANWDVAGDYPGKDDDNDTATIAIATNSNPVVLASNLGRPLSSVTINAATPNSADVGLRVQTNAQSASFGAVSLTGNGSYDAFLDIQATASASSVSVSSYARIAVSSSVNFTAGSVSLSSAGSGSDLAVSGAGTMIVTGFAQNSQPFSISGVSGTMTVRY